MKMQKTVINLGDVQIKNQKLYQQKKPISIENVDVNKIVVSNKVFFGKQIFKYSTGYKDAKKIRPLCISFLNMINKRL